MGRRIRGRYSFLTGLLIKWSSLLIRKRLLHLSYATIGVYKFSLYLVSMCRNIMLYTSIYDVSIMDTGSCFIRRINVPSKDGVQCSAPTTRWRILQIIIRWYCGNRFVRLWVPNFGCERMKKKKRCLLIHDVFDIITIFWMFSEYAPFYDAHS